MSTQYSFKYVWAGRELTIDIVGLNVRISDVQRTLILSKILNKI